MEMITAKEAMTEAIRRALDDMDRNQGRGREAAMMPSPPDCFLRPEGNRKSRRKAAAISRHKEPA